MSPSNRFAALILTVMSVAVFATAQRSSQPLAQQRAELDRRAQAQAEQLQAEQQRAEQQREAIQQHEIRKVAAEERHEERQAELQQAAQQRLVDLRAVTDAEQSVKNQQSQQDEPRSAALTTPTVTNFAEVARPAASTQTPGTSLSSALLARAIGAGLLAGALFVTVGTAIQRRVQHH